MPQTKALSTNPTVWKFMLGILVGLTLLFTMFFYFSKISIVIVTGIVLIIIVEKLGQNYERRMRMHNFKPWLNKLLGYGILVFWVGVGYLVLSTSIAEVDDAIGQANRGDADHVILRYFQQIQPFVPEIIADQVNILTVRDAQASILTGMTTLFKQISFFIFYGLLIIPLMVYTYFRRRHQILAWIGGLVPSKFHSGYLRASRSIGGQLHDYLEGRIVESTMISAICCFGFYIIGLQGWLFLGLLAGFLNIVPLFGPILGAIPPLIVSFADEPWVGIAVIVTIIIAQLVDNFYLIPFMISHRVKLDPLAVILLILVGSQLQGMMGVIFAIPIFLIYKIVISDAYEELIKIYK